MLVPFTAPVDLEKDTDINYQLQSHFYLNSDGKTAYQTPRNEFSGKNIEASPLKWLKSV